MPEYVDPDGGPVSVRFENTEDLSWLRFADDTFSVAEGGVDSSLVGSYTVNLTLLDSYPYGLRLNQAKFSFTLVVRVPEQPFHIYVKNNLAPEFATEPPGADEILQFEVGKAWEYLLPEVFDPDKDPVLTQLFNVTLAVMSTDES